jgi:hypothetical protein
MLCCLAKVLMRYAMKKDRFQAILCISVAAKRQKPNLKERGKWADEPETLTRSVPFRVVPPDIERPRSDILTTVMTKMDVRVGYDETWILKTGRAFVGQVRNTNHDHTVVSSAVFVGEWTEDGQKIWS